MSSRNYIREPRNDEDENMLNHIEHNLFDDQDTRGSTSSTSQTHDAPISTSSQLRTQFIDYYKFGTINIQGGFNNKLNDILHFFTLHNYDILILTETGLHQHINIDREHNKTTYSTFPLPTLNDDNTIHNIHLYTDDKGNTKGSGVSMIITDQLQKHIIRTNTFYGRILTVDLCFKGNHYIKFICCYLPANAVDDKDLIIKCYKEIENILIKAKHDHFECIVLGDFNISFDKFKKANHYPIWRREIKTILKNFDLKDLLKSFHDHPSPTHTTKRNEGPDIQSRIDYIFTSPHIFHHSFYAYTHQISADFFTTDHQALSCYLTQDYFKKKFNSSRKSLEKSPTYKPNTDPKIHFKYHLMTTESWSNYKVTNGIIYRQHINKLILPNTTPEQQIELYWSNIKDIIIQTKEKCIPYSSYKKYTKQERPLSLRQNNNKILLLRMILRKFSNIKLNRVQGDMDKWKDYWNTWNNSRKQIFVIDVHFNAKRTIWLPYTLTPDNISNVKKDLQSLLRISIVLHKQEEDSWTLKNINKYVNDRNNNLIHNQKRMINSILNRKPQKITLDRLHYYDHETNQFQFTNNPHIIAEQSNLHFQRLGKDLNDINNVKEYMTIQDLPLYWRSTYEPINNRDYKHMTSLEDEFSIEELSQVISSLPNNKAAGISGITYEDIKHTHQDFREYINKFFNYILQVQIYPRDWLHAFLFPIPKPKAWDCKIENTRPIVLLETFRKLFVKILTQRINIKLTTYNLINENNRAGLTGQSTLQPLQVIQHIIESAYKDKKPLWIGLQDLSKAYDRVNKSLLRLALQRLHFPDTITTLLISLFSNRKNNVILPFGLSADFDVLQGIDQGEVISPLLWIIYYDPMFTHLSQLTNNLHITSVNKITNIYQPDSDLQINYSASVVGYLDDTSWFASSKSQLESNLQIANSFYDMANITINHDKYTILTNIPKFCNKELQFQVTPDKSIMIKTASRASSNRILGIYINAFNSHTPTLKKIKKIISHFAYTMRFKKITHDHLIYIINKVLLPKLEYINQFTIFTRSQCDLLLAPVKKLFKQHLKLPISTHNNIIHNKLFPSINSFFYNQFYSHISIVNVIFNTPMFSTIGLQKILNTQYEFWIPNFPTSKDLVNPISSNYQSLLTRQLRLFNTFHITFLPHCNTSITGGGNSIVSYFNLFNSLDSLSTKDLQSLRKKRIMFMDQLTSLDGYFLSTWKDVKKQNPKANFKGPTPKWFQNLEKFNILVNDSSRRLLRDLMVSPPARFDSMSPSIRKACKYRPKNEWTISWDAVHQCELYGKTIEQQNDLYGTSLTYRTHYLPEVNADTRVNLTPKKVTPILRPCTGHCGHSVPFSGDLRPKCVIVSLTSHLILFNVHAKSFIPNRPFIKLDKSFIFPTTSLHTLRNRDLIIQLLEIAKQFLFQKKFIFYTDGSFSPIDVNSSTQTQMGFAWIEITDATPDSGPPPPSYKGALSFNPSSTKAEVYALLTAIIAVPDESELDIFTDSLNVIHTFHAVTNKLTSIRRKLKCNNHLAWRLIDTLIMKKSLIVHLHKVKAHSNDFWNDMADSLANCARQLAPYEINPATLPGSLMTPIWASIAPIDRDIRKFCHNLTDTYTFSQFLGNSSLSPIFDRFPLSSIHWPLTRAWLQFNPTSDVCSSTKSSHNAFKIKALNHILPCGDVLTKHYPDFYPDNHIPCPVCNNHQDTNEHLGICSKLLPIINTTLLEHKVILQHLLEKHTSSNPIFIKQSIDRFDLLLPISESNSFTHPIYLIIHQLVSQDFYNLVRSFTFNDKLTRLIIWEFLTSFHERIYQQIWPKHCSLLKLWELRNGITPKRKRDFRKKKPLKSRDHKTSQPITRSRVASTSHNRSQNLSQPRVRTNFLPPDGTLPLGNPDFLFPDFWRLRRAWDTVVRLLESGNLDEPGLRSN
ncbi:ribonuclease H-like domain-containing protein [Rhizophagus irregularis DAOM 181602=DAOM 197198]|nr:ribonuclease H-like domain-containing protein [Rhizophagus irregularis DAOM 181602=DAOM 197198]